MATNKYELGNPTPAKRNPFSLGGLKMVFDRGRYKEAGKVGSSNEKKGEGFLKSRAKKEPAQRQGLGYAINERKKQMAEIDREMKRQYK